MTESELNAPRPLPADERRVLGVLIEKSLTTPDAYPMTINAIVAGCNQKSNRSPTVSYDADDVEQTLDALREGELVNVVITGGGRVERYRQLSRIVFGWNEEHVAIMAELLLRGRQTCGELRSRASRMKAIESLERLRERLRELADAGYVRSSGPLEQRGVEVDHAMYAEGGSEMPAFQPSPAAAVAPAAAASESAAPMATEQSVAAGDEIADLRSTVAELQEQLADLRERHDRMEARLDSVL